MKDSVVGSASESTVLSHPSPKCYICKVKNWLVGLVKHVKIPQTEAMSMWHIVDRCERILPAP